MGIWALPIILPAVTFTTFFCCATSEGLIPKKQIIMSEGLLNNYKNIVVYLPWGPGGLYTLFCGTFVPTPGLDVLTRTFCWFEPGIGLSFPGRGLGREVSEIPEFVSWDWLGVTLPEDGLIGRSFKLEYKNIDLYSV